MGYHALTSIAQLLSAKREEIASQWLSELLVIWGRQYPGIIDEPELRIQTSRLLDALHHLVTHHEQDNPPEISLDGTLADVAREVSISRARAGFQPVDTAQFILTLKNCITRLLITDMAGKGNDLAASITVIADLLDRLSMLTFEAYVETRERIITQQSLSLQELSTPVLRLWDHMLLLPLVGVIDTYRARQVTERLLEAISRYEAVVTVIDVTGVPVLDTSVAKHIMKAVDASQLLGSRIVMTGISPEGAQTMTRLGISFEGVISRASLRAGLAEAFNMLGQRVVRTGGPS